MPTNEHVIDVSSADFQDQVVGRSHEVPVVVDFWADWCAPCRTLGPILEEAVTARAGDVVLAKVDVDRNRALATRFGIRGIPAVKGFRDGEVAEQFTGALPRRQVEDFLDRLVPSDADRLAADGVRLAAEGDVDGARGRFEAALDRDPRHRVAAIELARTLVASDPGRALELLRPHRPDPAAEQVAAQADLTRDGTADVERLRLQLERSDDDPAIRYRLGTALAARGDHEEALEHLLVAVRSGGDEAEDARERILAIFRLLGDDDPLVADARRRLASALF